MAQVQAHNTAWTRSLIGVVGLQSFFLTEEEQHSSGIQVDIEGVTSNPATVDYTPIGAVDNSIRKSPIDNVVTEQNGLVIWPLKAQRIWIDLTPAGAGPFNVLVVGFKA